MTTKLIEKSKSPKKPESESMNNYPFITLAIFTLFMLTLPLATYYFIASFVPDSVLLPSMGAILIVQVIVGIYVYIAWREENRDYNISNKKK